MDIGNRKILCVIGNHNRNENSLRCLELLRSQKYDAYIIDSGSDVKPKYKHHRRVIECPNIYWGGIYKETLELMKKRNSEYVLHIDDDILISDEYFKRLTERIRQVVDSGKIGIYQPTTKADSHNVVKNNFNAGTNDIRLTDTIEEWMYLIKRDVILKTDSYGLDFETDVKHGWWFGYVMCKASSELGYANVVDDYVTVEHPQGPATYNVGEAGNMMGVMYRKLKMSTRETLNYCHDKNGSFKIEQLLGKKQKTGG